MGIEIAALSSIINGLPEIPDKFKKNILILQEGGCWMACGRFCMALGRCRIASGRCWMFLGWCLIASERCWMALGVLYGLWKVLDGLRKVLDGLKKVSDGLWRTYGRTYGRGVGDYSELFLRRLVLDAFQHKKSENNLENIENSCWTPHTRGLKI